MPTVYLPLGSSEAYGQVGEMMIYQGTWVRRYVVPYDPRTDAQLDVRNLFHDVTKMVRSGSSWARGTWASLAGPRWFPILYRSCSKDFLGSWSQAQIDWEAMSEIQQTAWNESAPYQATFSEQGRIFFSVARVVSKLLDASGYPDYELPVADGDNSAAVATWWSRELDGALIEGFYEDGHPDLIYSANWDVVSDGSAHGGSYHQQSGAGLASCTFYWTGTALRVYFNGQSGFGIMQIRTDPEYMNVDLAGGSHAWQKSVLLSGLYRGLHFGIIRWHEFGLINIDAIEITR